VNVALLLHEAEHALTVRDGVIPHVTTAWRTRATTIDEATRSVEAVLATETPVEVIDLDRFETVDESLRMVGAQFPRQVPLLDAHNRKSCDDHLGSVRHLRVDRDRLVGRLYFASSSDPRAQRAWEKVRAGHLTDVSIGYLVTEAIRVEPGRTKTVNGRTLKAGPKKPLRVATRWVLREASLAPIGSDQAAQVREFYQDPLKPSMAIPMRALRNLGAPEALIAEAIDKGWSAGEALAIHQLRDEATRRRATLSRHCCPETSMAPASAGDLVRRGSSRVLPEGPGNGVDGRLPYFTIRESENNLPSGQMT